MKYVVEDQPVLVPLSGRLVPCVVAASHGRTARVINELLRIDTWADVKDLQPVLDSEERYDPLQL